MWASSPGPGRPFSIGNSGAGAWNIFSHSRQAYFGRTCRITLSLADNLAPCSAGDATTTPIFTNSATPVGWFNLEALLRPIIGDRSGGVTQTRQSPATRERLRPVLPVVWGHQFEMTDSLSG